jgi:hypothetical protein
VVTVAQGRAHQLLLAELLLLPTAAAPVEVALHPEQVQTAAATAQTLEQREAVQRVAAAVVVVLTPAHREQVHQASYM